MPYTDLEKHKDRSRLMRIAYTCKHGTNSGERLLKQNPEFKRLVKEANGNA